MATAQESRATGTVALDEGLQMARVVAEPGQESSPVIASAVGKPLLEPSEEIKFSVRNLTVRYGDLVAVRDVSLDIGCRQVTALIGPSGCGKSTFLRCLNRMNDIIPSCVVRGEVQLDREDVYAAQLDVVELRSRVGMVFQKPNPFPKSIYDNVAYGLRLHGKAGHAGQLDALVETSLRRAGLWDEVKDLLAHPATSLSGGQQQRLCIARTIAIQPEVILMDEPCSSLDPIATARIEALISELKRDYTIVIVTHSMQQASRVSDRTAYFHIGQLLEVNATEKIFTAPEHPGTEDYITGRIG